MSARDRIAMARSLGVRAALWWCGALPLGETRPVLAIRAAAAVIAAVFAAIVFARVTTRLWDAAPAPIAADGPAEGVRFGLPESDRRAIFRELAAAEPGEIASAERRFGGQPWSIEDDRASGEHEAVTALATRRKINATVVYLILDEGIRAKWPGADGRPLRAAVAPLDPRPQ